MTSRARSARALRDVRERLRDVAAASHATVVANHDRTRRHLAVAEESLEAFLDDAQQALAGARNVHDLDRVAIDHAHARTVIADAATVHETSITHMVASHETLRHKARELRTAEKLVDKIDIERGRLEARLEQIAMDDLTRRPR